MWMINIFVVLLAAMGLVLFVLAPSFGCRRANSWRSTPFAHRGLHGEGVSENSIAAFDRACMHGFGIELDVQLSADGRVVVFHDDDLKRMTGDTRRVDEVSYDELAQLHLPDGSSIPLFEDVLCCVNGRTPLLVELKNGKRNDELCQKTLKLLREYTGAYVVESFNPLIVRWFRRHAPEIIRGQLVTDQEGYLPAFSGFRAWLLSNLALNMLARPDFVAYDGSVKDFKAVKIQRRIFKTPLAAWTIKNPERCRKLVQRGEMPIFEGFLPERK